MKNKKSSRPTINTMLTLIQNKPKDTSI